MAYSYCCIFERTEENKNTEIIVILHCFYPVLKAAHRSLSGALSFNTLPHRRRKTGGGGAWPSNYLRRGGGQHTLWPPNNPPTFSFKFYVKQEKYHKCTKLKGNIIINVNLI